MKNGCTFFIVLIFMMVVIYNSCEAQITIKDKVVTMQADTMSVQQAFRLLNYMVPKSQADFTLKVVKDGKEYIQYRYLINRMLKRYAYTEVNGKVKLVRI